MTDSTHRFERDRLFKKWGQFRTIALSKFCKDQMTMVQHYFGNGFGEQPNFGHEILEF